MFQQLAHHMLFDLMSPSTLAGLIHDIEDLGDGAEPYALDIARVAREALDANCGAEDAARYLAAPDVTGELIEALADLADGHSMAGESRARAALAKVTL